MKKIILIFIIGVVLTAGFIYIFKQNNSKNTVKPELKISQDGGVTFEVNLIDFNFNNPVKFDITVNTHSDSLDFDLTKISFLRDNKGGQYLPSNWEGDGPGGHHISGILSFPKLANQPKSIKLIIEDIIGRPRVLEWDLK
ncbi:MAG: hypothetical protein Q7R46_00715 [bacterium]|nr:hypothetical protein [bacterium]